MSGIQFVAFSARALAEAINRRIASKITNCDHHRPRSLVESPNTKSLPGTIGSCREVLQAGSIRGGRPRRRRRNLRVRPCLLLAVAAKRPTVYLIAGVNGSGKTTSIAKLAQHLKDKGNTILLAACKSIGCTGLILTKLDGTAKGGIVVAVRQTMNLPVTFIGIGEALDDLQPFDADTFVESLFVA